MPDINGELTIAERKALGRLYCNEPSRTQQHLAEECNINTIVKRFGLTGKVPTALRAPVYGDFTGVGDYQSALNALVLAENSFLAMPADVRKRFDNDPGKFVDFCSDSANLDEMRKLGLAIPAEGSAIGDRANPTAEPGAGGA